MRNYSMIRLHTTIIPDSELSAEVKSFLEGLELSIRARLSTERAIRQLHLRSVEAATFYLRGVAMEKMPCPNAGDRTRQELREKLGLMA